MITLESVLSPCINFANSRHIRKIAQADILNAYHLIGVDVSPWIICDIDIFQCEETGYRFYYPFDLAGTTDFYSLLSSSRQYYNPWRWEHQKALEYLNQHGNIGSIFEFGCGPGYFLKEIKADQKIGVDFNKESIKNIHDADNILLVDTDNYDSSVRKESLDVVCMFQVLEHLPNVHQFLCTINNLIKADGLLIVGVPNNNPYLYRWDVLHALNLPPHHMGLWDEKSLVNAMRMHGFKSVLLEFEPLMDIDYWLTVNLEHYLGDNQLKNILMQILKKKVFTPITSRFTGRNLLGIFRKIGPC